MLTARFNDAFHYARQLHQSQTRKGTAIPYISHLMTVSALVIEHGGDEDQAIAGLLHDAAEDCGGAPRLAEIRAKFGDAVADIVADCTDAWTDPKPPWRPRKEAYLKALPGKPQSSLLVSLADKTHNAEAILWDYRALGDSLWDRFNGGADGTRWYYGALAACFANVSPGPLSDRLSRAIEAFGGPKVPEVITRMESVGPHSKGHLEAWWQPILQMRLDDPQQEAPFWLATNNVVLNTPFPGIQIKAYAVVGTSKAGVFLSGTRRANVFAIQKQLKQERAALLKELPKGTEIDAGHYHPVWANRSDFKSDHARQKWIMSTMNAFVKVLRPRLRRWYEGTRR